MCVLDRHKKQIAQAEERKYSPSIKNIGSSKMHETINLCLCACVRVLVCVCLCVLMHMNTLLIHRQPTRGEALGRCTNRGDVKARANVHVCMSVLSDT